MNSLVLKLFELYCEVINKLFGADRPKPYMANNQYANNRRNAYILYKCATRMFKKPERPQKVKKAKTDKHKMIRFAS